jgi:hypothetical protein
MRRLGVSRSTTQAAKPLTSRTLAAQNVGHDAAKQECR